MCKPLLASINSPRLCGHSVVLCVVATRVWFIRCFHTTKKNLGGPGSSKGKLERIRAGLTVYQLAVPYIPVPGREHVLSDDQGAPGHKLLLVLLLLLGHCLDNGDLECLRGVTFGRLQP